LSVLLDLDAVALAPIVVEARSIRAERSLAGFYDRKKRGFGRFYTFRDLERRRGWTLRSLLGEAGVQIRCGPADCLPVSWGGTRPNIPARSPAGRRRSPRATHGVQLDDAAGLGLAGGEGVVPADFQVGRRET